MQHLFRVCRQVTSSSDALKCSKSRGFESQERKHFFYEDIRSYNKNTITIANVVSHPLQLLSSRQSSVLLVAVPVNSS